VTSLADALKVNFALITTDKRRPLHGSSAWHSRRPSPSTSENGDAQEKEKEKEKELEKEKEKTKEKERERIRIEEARAQARARGQSNLHRRVVSGGYDPRRIPHPDSHIPHHLSHQESTEDDVEEEEEDYNDDKVSDITTGRLVSGHIVDDDYPSSMTTSMILDKDDEHGHMMASVYSTTSSVLGVDSHALGGTGDAQPSDDEDEVPTDEERMITLVGEVRGKTALIVDDMIDRAGSWIAAAEHAVKRCGAKKVYCLATHGLFGEGCLAEMEECKCIDKVYFSPRSLSVVQNLSSFV